MLDVAQLQKRIAADFPDATQVGEAVVRFVRRAESQPYAVCYLDVSDKLPSDQDALTRYQDGIIGKHYFDDKKSLQWSNYLYFVTTARRLASKELLHVRKLIEADRSYARKFVISEDEIEEILSPPAIVPAGTEQLPSILSTWTQRLADAGLDEAVLGEGDNPARIAAIEASMTHATKRPPKAKHPSPKREPAPPFIRTFELTRYRGYPLQRRFDFGSVNLIVGPNATGKTSLLEAVELYYCGRNKRSPDKTADYELNAKLADGKPDKATSNRKAALFRERNLIWYGQPEIKTNELYKSFAQFNFLDTDAAVHISDTPVDIEGDLAKLLIGPDASTVWRNMERVLKAIDEKLRELVRLRKQVDDERIPLGQRIEAAGKVKVESEPLSRRLDDMLKRTGWNPLQTNGQRNGLDRLVPLLSELSGLIDQATTMDWVPSPVSLTALKQYVAITRDTIKKAEPSLNRLEKAVAAQKLLEVSIGRANTALTHSHQAKRIIEAGVVQRDEERKRLRDKIARDSQQTASMDVPQSGGELLSEADTNSVEARCALAESRKTSAEQALQQARTAQARFASLRDRSVMLAQQLRQIAGEILKDNPNPDECPLCHTHFSPGELAAHMALGVDPHLENANLTLAGQIRQQEIALQTALAAEAALSRLREFSRRMGLPKNVSIGSALSALAEAKRSLAAAKTRLVELDQQAQTLAEQGISTSDLQRATVRLSELQHPLAAPNAQAIATLIATIEKDLARLRAAFERDAAQIDKDESAIQKLLGTSERGVGAYTSLVSRLKEALVTSETVASDLSQIAKSHPWRENTPLAELSVSIKSLRTVAGELQAALAREKREQTLHAGSVARKVQLDQQATELIKNQQRFDEASASLKALMSEHSLNGAMEATLKLNRVAIETIFSRIHAPPEFEGLGKGFDTLMRKSGGEARLREISTGQRAAFALSIFLAQNSQLLSAPPVMLIDDPIAHVDDLNALSFLDYLRDIALEDQRQVFFATANEKIATLFERKFDFLGRKFQKIALSREE